MKRETVTGLVGALGGAAIAAAAAIYTTQLQVSILEKELDQKKSQAETAEEREAAARTRLDAARDEWKSATDAAETQRKAMKEMLELCMQRVASSEGALKELRVASQHEYARSEALPVPVQQVAHSGSAPANIWDLMGPAFAAQKRQEEHALQQYQQMLQAIMRTPYQ